MTLTDRHGLIIRLECAKRSISEAMYMLEAQPLSINTTSKKVKAKCVCARARVRVCACVRMCVCMWHIKFVLGNTDILKVINIKYIIDNVNWKAGENPSNIVSLLIK